VSDERLLIFEVDGKPEPQGSATAFVPLDGRGFPMARGGRNADGSYRKGSVIVNITSDNAGLKKWRRCVEEAAREAWGDGRPPIEETSLRVEAHFFLKRPEGHWRTGRYSHLLKDDAPAAPTTIPDADKLLRAVLDGMSGVVYKDDALVTCAPPEKHYAVPNGTEHEGQGVTIVVSRRAAQTALDLPEDQRVRWVPEHVEDPSQLVLQP
jgi:Holliday junction resolvase RusA-like endonuclease